MISEEMIKNAATEADQAIRDSLPAPAKCEHKFSPLFQRKMCRSFRMVKHPVIYKLLRYAACFVLAAALASGTWLTANAEARTAFFAWMREQYEAFVEYRFTGEASQENESADYELTWLPEGFSLQKEQNLDGGTYADNLIVISPNESHTFHYDIGSAVVLESNKTYQIVKVVSAGQTNHSVFASFEIK